MKYKLEKILNVVKCGRNSEFEKRTDQNFITQNLCHGKDYRIFKEKRTIKKSYYMDKFWLLLGGGPFNGWWWVVVDTFWLEVGGSGYW